MKLALKILNNKVVITMLYNIRNYLGHICLMEILSVKREWS